MNLLTIRFRIERVLLLSLALVMALSLVTGSLQPAAAAVQDSPGGPLDWSQIAEGLPQGCTCQVTFSPQYASDRTMFAHDDLDGTYRSRTAGASWEHLSALVSLLAISPQFASDQTLFGLQFISSVATLVRSTNGGDSWTPVWSGLPPGELKVRLSPNFASDHTVFLAADHYAQGGVWRSTDSGVTWNPSAQLLTPVVSANMNYGVELLALSPLYALDHTLWAVTHNQMIDLGGGLTPFSGYLYRSKNGGSTWEALGLPAYGGYAYNLYELRPSPTYASDHKLWGVTEIPDTLPSDGLLWTSIDEGSTWQQLPNQPAGATNGLPNDPGLLAFSPAFAIDHTVYFSSNDGVYRSFNAGLTWELVDDFTYTFYDWWSYIAISPDYAQDATLYITLSSGVYHSQDAGKSWKLANFTSEDGNAVAVSLNYDSDQTVWAGLGARGLFKSTNGGETWQETNLGEYTKVWDIAVSPADSSLWLATDEGVYRSPDGGTTLLPLSSGITDTFVTNIAVSPNFAVDQTVLVGTYSGIFRTTNSGTSWTFAGGQPDFWNYVEDLAISPNFAVDHTVFAAYRYSGVYRTTDSGATWQPLGLGSLDPANPSAISVAISPDYATDHTLWAGTEHHGIYVSTNNGATWVESKPLLEDCRSLLADGSGIQRRVYAGCKQSGGGYYSLYSQGSDGIWENAGPDLYAWQVLSLAKAPGSGALFAAVAKVGLWRADPYPDTPRSLLLSPEAGGGGSLESWFGEAAITFPNGSVANETLVTMVAGQSGASPAAGAVWLAGVELSAEANGTPVTTFLQTFTLTFDYSNLAITPFNEANLAVYSDSGGGWTSLPVTRDLANDKISIQANHFSQYALVAQGGRVFLPMLRR